LQVSDRRVSLLSADGSSSLRDDVTNKAVLHSNRSVFGFTGLAELQRRRTDLWIADRLAASEQLGEAFEHIRDDLTRLFKRRPYRDRRHAVVAAGFEFEPDQSLTPYYAVVSNFFRVGQWFARAQPDFLWGCEACPANTFGLFQAPAWLPNSQYQRLRRNVRSIAQRSLESSYAIRLLVEAIREITARESSVGRELMLTVLPKSAAYPRPDVMVLSGIPSTDTPTFLHLPYGSAAVTYGPTFVFGGSVLSDFKAGALGSEGAMR
jgi:hypothetical protein